MTAQPVPLRKKGRITDNETKLTATARVPVADNQNVMTAGPRGPQVLQDIWFLEKLAHFDREVIPERRMHAKGSGAYGTFTVTHDITRYTRARIFAEIGKRTELFARFSTVAGEHGAADVPADSAPPISSTVPRRKRRRKPSRRHRYFRRGQKLACCGNSSAVSRVT